MRLIVEYTELADCGGDSFTISVPVIWDSKEAFLAEFDSRLKSGARQIEMGGNCFFAYQFKKKDQIIAPIVYTVDEWFEQCEKNIRAGLS